MLQSARALNADEHRPCHWHRLVTVELATRKKESLFYVPFGPVATWSEKNCNDLLSTDIVRIFLCLRLRSLYSRSNSFKLMTFFYETTIKRCFVGCVE
jgi:hypothetical protein